MGLIPTAVISQHFIFLSFSYIIGMKFGGESNIKLDVLRWGTLVETALLDYGEGGQKEAIF